MAPSRRELPKLAIKPGIKLFPEPLSRPLGQDAVWRGIARDEKGKAVPVIVKEGLEDALRREYEIKNLLEPGSAILTQYRADPKHVKDTLYLVVKLHPAHPDTPEVAAPSLPGILYGNNKLPQFSESSKTRDRRFLDQTRDRLLDQLEEVHRRGVVNGDIKLYNVVLEIDAEGNPHPHIIDYGLASRIGELALPFSYGTAPFWGSREVFARRTATPLRDVKAMQRLLAQMYLPDSMLRAEHTGITRSAMGPEGPVFWKDPLYAFDDGKGIPPELGLVLASHLPEDVPTLKAMIAESKEPRTFVAKFSQRWAEAFQRQQYFRESDDLALDLLQARNLGPKVFARLDGRTKYLFIRRCLKGLSDAMIHGASEQGWPKRDQLYELVEAFLKAPAVAGYLAENEATWRELKQRFGI